MCNKSKQERLSSAFSGKQTNLVVRAPGKDYSINAPEKTLIITSKESCMELRPRKRVLFVNLAPPQGSAERIFPLFASYASGQASKTRTHSHGRSTCSSPLSNTKVFFY
jgi:hypothetical protein